MITITSDALLRSASPSADDAVAGDVLSLIYNSELDESVRTRHCSACGLLGSGRDGARFTEVTADAPKVSADSS